MTSATSLLVVLALATSALTTDARLTSRAFHANIIKAGLAADIYATVTAKDENNVLTLSIAVAPCCTGAALGRRLSGSPAARAGAACIKDCKAAGLKAAALSTLLASRVRDWSYGFKDPELVVSVTQGGKPVAPGVAPTKPDAMATLLKRALLGNAYFKGIVQRPRVQGRPSFGYTFFATFAPKVVQIDLDNPYDLNGLQTSHAAELMENVFQIQQRKVFLSTVRCANTECIVTA